MFAHGSSAHTTAVDMWLNDTRGLALEGDTNRDVRNATGGCVVAPMNLTRTGDAAGPHGDPLYRIWFGPWARWPAPAQAVVDAAGRRATFPTPRVPPLSPPLVPNAKPPADCAPPPGGRTGRFAATPCQGLQSQLWLLDAGVAPGDGAPTSVQRDHAQGGCWEIESCAGSTVNCNWGCMPLPKNTSRGHCAASPCDCHGGWSTLADGSIRALSGTCLEVTGGDGSAVVNAACTGKANQKFLFKDGGVGFDGRKAWAVAQETPGGQALCIDVDAK